MNKEDILKILEGAEDKNGDVPMRLVRQAFEKLPELCTDTISRQTAIDVLEENKEMINAVLDSLTLDYNARRNQEQRRGQINEDIETIKALPSAQPDGIPLEWIDKHLEWLDNCDNDFAQLAKVSIRAMVEIWKKDKI